MSDERMWFYMDSTGQEFGPYPSNTMKGWFQQGFFPMQGELQVRLDDMPQDQHYYIKDLYPGPIMERAFDGEPNLPSQSGGRPAGRGNRSGGRGGGGGGAPPPMDPLGGSYGGDLGLAAGMPWMMPGMPGAQSGMMPGFPPMPGMRGMPGMPGMGMMPGMMPGMPPMGPGAATGRFQGRIKSFNVQKGFGFIECPEAHQVYGRDVFLHKAQIASYQIGSQVSFAVEMNKTNMPQARDLLESDMLAGFGGGLMGGFGGFPGGGGGKGNSKGGKGKGRGGGRGDGKGRGAGPGGEKKPKPAGEKKGGGGKRPEGEGGPPPAPVVLPE